jgi:AcrR family transcriptional regulator
MRDGFAQTSTLAIATAAGVSKRDLYAHFGSKGALLAACIEAHAEHMRQPIRSSRIRDHGGLTQTLIQFGMTILQEASDPAVIGVYRLAVSESVRLPKLAQILHQAGRATNLAALAQLLKQAQSLGLIRAGSPRPMATTFMALLWGDLPMQLLLGVIERPTPAAALARAAKATEQFLELYAQS